MMEKHLQSLVGFYPETALRANVERLLNYVADVCAKQGLQTTFLHYGKTPNLYVHTAGAKHSRVLLQAHVDVVSGKEQAFKVEGDTYYGRGVYDMLFATAAYLQLIEELGPKGLAALDLGFMFSGDEENGGFNGVNQFIEDGYTTDICVLPDAGSGFGGMSTGAKGIYGCTVRITGASHHGSRPWEGDGAGSKMVNFLHELQATFDQASEASTRTMTIAKIAAGDVDNRGPAHADAMLDIRYLTTNDLEIVQSDVKRLLHKYDGEIISLVEGSNFELDHEHELVQQFTKLYTEHHGDPLSYATAHGSSDARFFAANGTPVIMVRPDGGGAHGDQEWISRTSLEKFYRLLKDYVLETAAKA